MKNCRKVYSPSKRACLFPFSRILLISKCRILIRFLSKIKKTAETSTFRINKTILKGQRLSQPNQNLGGSALVIDF